MISSNNYPYRGYMITYDPNRPPTGRWRADRYGCGMCNNSEASIKRMVDVKLYEKEMERKLRESQS